MSRRTPLDLTTLALKAQVALNMTQGEFGAMLGVTRRTIIRWGQSGPQPGPEAQRVLVQRVHAVDPVLASQIATAWNETLESLGVPPPVPAAPPALPSPPVVAPPAPLPAVAPARTPTPLAPRDLADSIVCAAAEAVGLAPQAIRPALVAAFDRAAALGLEVSDVRKGLGGATPSSARSR